MGDEIDEIVEEIYSDISEKVISLILEVIEVSLYQILYYRGVYRQQFFRNAQRYSLTLKEVRFRKIIFL